MCAKFELVFNNKLINDILVKRTIKNDILRRLIMIRKILPSGIDNFKELIDNDFYYIDKTLLIKEILDNNNKIDLITRPRRFGKTLNMSMLQYFFEKSLENNKSTSYLFEGLNIFTEENKKYRDEQGKYPLIYLTFKNAKLDNWKDTFYNINEVISDEYKRHAYLLNSTFLLESEKEVFRNIMNFKAEKNDVIGILKNLSKYLKEYHKEDVVIIIDEYDTPLQSGYVNAYLHQVIEFMKSMLVKGFKDNKALKRGILTGIMKVAKESIFSDFNNASVSTVLSNRYKDKFGFTEDEVINSLKYYGLEDKIEEIKKWYNGYIFGKEQVIYNPWSIISYLSMPSDGFMPYWINTSSNEMIKEVLQLDKAESKKTIELLLEKKRVSKPLLENVVYENITKNPESAWSFLLHAGYLKASNKTLVSEGDYEYDIEIPNIEVKTIYKHIIMSYFKDDIKISSLVEGFIKALINGDLDKFSRILKRLYLSHVSYYDIGILDKFNEIEEEEQDTRYENFHHGFILGLLMYANTYYEIHSNREYGLGRPDIVLISKEKTNSAYVFEFKWASTQSKKTLESLLKLASDQIKEKKYVEGVRSIHDVSKIIKVAVGFRGKEIDMEIT